MNTPGPRRSEIVAVYAAGLFQGLSLVAVPAAATILTSADGYDLSASQYGLLFLPQVILAIAGSLALPSLAGTHRSQARAPRRPRRRHGGDGTARHQQQRAH